MVHEAQRKLVQEVAAGSLEAPPSQYVLREEDRPTDVATEAELVIPTVDLRRLADPGDVEETAKLRSALQSWGLFVVTGHGMPEALLDDMLSSSMELFHLPPEEKVKYSNVINGEKFQNEGYGVDRIDTDEQILDWCDRLYIQVQPEEERKLELWPAKPPSLVPLLNEFTLKSEGVARPLLRAMARSMGFREGVFLDQLGDKATTWARFTFYPPCPRPDLVHGLKPHTDNSIITVLLLDHAVGGLQVLKDGSWVDVPVLDHDLLVVLGDDMEIMSNGLLKAPTHRVVTSDKERMSLVLFYAPEPQKDIEPVQELVDEKRPALYKNIKAHTYTDGFFDAFALGERAIDLLGLKVQEAAASSS
ncbi:hypothetical protein ACP70R_019813 [Stipagrostis hirtigluma subsp. patula]